MQPATSLIGLKNLGKKTVFLTGATQGIGLQAAKVLSAMGAHIVLGSRSLARGQEVIEKELIPFRDQHLDKIKNPTSEQQRFVAIKLDLSSFKDVHLTVNDYLDHVGVMPDVIVCNAGQMTKSRQQSEDGNELTLQSNFLSHALLQLKLIQQTLPLAQSDQKSIRVVNTGAGVYRQVQMNFDDLMCEKSPYDFWKVYCQSKLAQLLMSNYIGNVSNGALSDQALKFLSNNSKQVKVESVTIDPGYIKTNLLRRDYGFSDDEINKKLGAAKMTFDQGAFTLVKAVLADEDVNGGFMFGGRLIKQTEYPLNIENQKKLWDLTKKIINF